MGLSQLEIINCPNMPDRNKYPAMIAATTIDPSQLLEVQERVLLNRAHAVLEDDGGLVTMQSPCKWKSTGQLFEKPL